MTAPTPQHRVVLLGASNLARSFSLITNVLRETLGHPLDVMAAIGHGRSYGRPSQVMGRKIPGIFSCGLWEELRRRPPLPTSALVTDVGNDILYGAPADELLGWVATCLDRLTEADATTIVTQLPVDTIGRLGARQFLLYRTLLFPQSRLTLSEAKTLSQHVNQQLVELAREKKSTIFAVQNRWYGFDPVHIHRSQAMEAWREILAAWTTRSTSSIRQNNSIWQTAYLHLLPPEQRAIFGICRPRPQPCGVLADGTMISLY